MKEEIDTNPFVYKSGGTIPSLGMHDTKASSSSNLFSLHKIKALTSVVKEGFMQKQPESQSYDF